ncbi:MAG TPA: ATP synthase A1 subunit C [Methanothrix sp.]|nr:ATP synthase A1 subunit C [Methanothrix sp.]HQA61774.1 ATP synthase A1 subunit C [Methanothrix sp.]
MTLEELAASLGFSSFPPLFAVALAVALVVGLIIFVPVLLRVIEIADYAYSNSRIQVMSSRIIREDKLKEMIEASSLAEVVAALETTEYSPYLREMMEERSESIERALNRHTADAYREVATMVPMNLKKILTVLIRKWDVYNIKLILRGVYAERSPDDIRADLVQVGELDPQKIGELAEARSLEEAISNLDGTPYSRLAESLQIFDQTRNLTVLEAKLDNILYEDAWKNATSQPVDENLLALKNYLATNIDVVNLKFVFRAKKDGLAAGSIENYIVKGGGLQESFIKSTLEVDTVDNVVASLEGTKYYQPVIGAVPEYESTGSILPIELALDGYLARVGKDISITQPFGIGPAIGYLSLKEMEVRNVRTLARGIEAGLSPDEIRNLIMKVGS